MFSVCAQMGVSRMPRTIGFMIGPPAEREYAVEPVGEATINPSALHATSGVLFTVSPSVITRATSPLVTTMSLIA